MACVHIIMQWHLAKEKLHGNPHFFLINGVLNQLYHCQGSDVSWNPTVSGAETSVRPRAAEIEEVGRINEETG